MPSLQPATTVVGKVAHLSYKVPHRIHDAKIYPVTAPNGSTIVLYASECGVGILWRGGRPIKADVPPPSTLSQAVPAKVNGSKDAIMVIDSDDDGSVNVAEAPQMATFESEDMELDPAAPYPSVVQHIHLPLNAHVLHLSAPPIPQVIQSEGSDAGPPLFASKMVFAVACSDASVRIITLPLNPPPDKAARQSSTTKPLYGEDIVTVPAYAGLQASSGGVSVTWTSKRAEGRAQPLMDRMDTEAQQGNTGIGRSRSPRKKAVTANNVQTDDVDGYDLLIAAQSAELGGIVKIWRAGITKESIAFTNPTTPYRTLFLQRPVTALKFNTAHYPRERHSQLLIADSTGILQVYDPLAFPQQRNGPFEAPSGSVLGRFRSNFEQLKGRLPAPPALSSRKAIIDAAWTGNGHSILALMADGEWGIWSLADLGSKPSSRLSNFSLGGYVGFAEVRHAGGALHSRKNDNRGALVPMTPNTRRRREDTLFQGHTADHVTIARGRVSVSAASCNVESPPTETAVIWHNADVIKLKDLNKLLPHNGPSKIGPSPTVSAEKIQNLSFHGETIANIDQFPLDARETHVAVSTRDILLAVGHRLDIIMDSPRSAANTIIPDSSNTLTSDVNSRRSDQALLHRQELDIGGMDRLLDGMDKSTNLALGGSRKVLFAA